MMEEPIQSPPGNARAHAQIVQTIAVPGSPNRLVMNRAGTRLYVASATASGSLTVLDTQPLSVLQTIENLGSPIWLAINPAGSRIYVSDNSAASGNPITVIETVSNSVIARITGFTTVNGMALNSTGTRLYVADHGASELVTIDTSDHQRVTEIPVRYAKEVIVAPRDDTRVYVVSDLAGWSIVDLENKPIVRQLAIAPGNPTSIGHSPRYPRIYITHRDAGRLTIGDALIPEVSKYISGLNEPWGVAFNPLSEMAYITERDQISIYDTRLESMVGTIAGFGSPRGIVVAPDGRNLYVADIQNQSICMVRL